MTDYYTASSLRKLADGLEADAKEFDDIEQHNMLLMGSHLAAAIAQDIEAAVRRLETGSQHIMPEYADDCRGERR